MKWMVSFFVIGCSLQPIYGHDTIHEAPRNSEVVRRIARVLSENPIIIEAGTHDGEDTIELTELLPKAHIFTFEAVPELFNKSVERLEKFYNIKVYNYALSDKAGTATMYLSEMKDNPGVVSQSSSLLIPKEHIDYAPHVLFKETIEVETATIDDLTQKIGLGKVDFLKLDIQGNELNVLMASPNTLANVKAVLMEVEFVEAYEGQYLYEDIKLWMEKQGFELDALFVQCDWFGDGLFIRKN